MKLLSAQLKDLEDADLTNATWGGFSSSELQTLEQRGAQIYKGKVREMVGLGSHLWMVHTDRLSAFDRFIGLVPWKGILLTELSWWWLRQAQKVVPTHLISRPHPRVIKVKPTQPFKVEVVVRGALAGSMLRAREAGEKQWCGVTIPQEVRPWGLFEQPIITPTTKAAAFEHDENISAEALIDQGICSAQDWATITQLSQKLFRFGQDTLRQHGWILADTKYEFGRAEDGTIVVIDEIHTPDSSRYWDSKSWTENVPQGKPPVMFDKENIRRWLMAHHFSGHGNVPPVPRSELLALAKTYLKVTEKLVGTVVTPEGNSAVPQDLFL